VSRSENDPLMDIRAVASWTGLSVGTLYHLISQKRIPVVRISSRCVRFRLSDLEQWLEDKVVPAQEPLGSVAGQPPQIPKQTPRTQRRANS
jgi:excisionase family DNA binding protein